MNYGSSTQSSVVVLSEDYEITTTKIRIQSHSATQSDHLLKQYLDLYKLLLPSCQCHTQGNFCSLIIYPP